MLLVGRGYLARGKLPLWTGMWWLHIPVLLLGVWLLCRDAGADARPPARAASLAVLRMIVLRPRLHDKLVVRAVFGPLITVWAVLLAFNTILNFAAELDSLGKGDYKLTQVVLYIACTIPRRCYDLFPTAALIGSLLGLGGLAATSELTALRAAGISRSRICVGAVAGLRAC